MPLRFIVMLLVTGLVLGGVFGFKWFIGGQVNAFFDSMPAPTVTINAAEADEEGWFDEIHAIGSLAPVRGTRLSLETPGLVDDIRFENGQRVEAGDVLIVLDTQTDAADLERLRAEARLAEQELTRAQQLINENNVSRAELQRREADALAARSAVVAQEARLAQKTLRAPFSGQLGLRQVELGQFVAAGEPIVDLVDLERLHVNFTVTERDLQRLNVGQTVQVLINGSDDPFDAEIRAIAPRLRAASRTAEIQATFDNPEGRLRPEQFARVTIEVGDENNVLVVPQTAVRFNPYGNSVFVVEKSTDEDGETTRSVTERFVQTGQRRGEMIAITDNLERGTTIATSGLLKLQNGSPVEISDDADPQDARNHRER